MSSFSIIQFESEGEEVVPAVRHASVTLSSQVPPSPVPGDPLHCMTGSQVSNPLSGHMYM